MSIALSTTSPIYRNRLSQSCLTVGTRGSPLALRQTRLVVSALSQAYPDIHSKQKIITTTGDRILDRHLADVGGKGLFAKELDTALLGGEIDFAVHSLKDLETNLPSGIALACVLPRADPRDVLVLSPNPVPHHRTRPLPMLRLGARVGTASARRQAQLLFARPDLRIELIRGNVQTRLGRLGPNGFDATLLAAAGLNRLGLEMAGTVPLPASHMTPAACQGIIGITARAEDTFALELFGSINHGPTWAAALAERAMLRVLDGSCRTPIGAYAEPLAGGGLLLTGMVARSDGSFLLKRWRRGCVSGAEALGHELGQSLRRDSPNDLFA